MEIERSTRYYMIREVVRLLFWSAIAFASIAALFLMVDAALHFLLPSNWQGGRG